MCCDVWRKMKGLVRVVRRCKDLFEEEGSGQRVYGL